MDTKSTELDTLSAPMPSDQRGPEDYARIAVRRGRGGFDPEADAIARAARYQFRQRAVLAMVLAAVMSGALAIIVSSTLWWVCASSGVVLVTYLAYLRRQVRMEEEIRRRRMARLTRSRLGVESTTDEELHLLPPRLFRRGAKVVDVDDEDPAFEHLEAPGPDAAAASRGRMRAASGQ